MKRFQRVMEHTGPLARLPVCCLASAWAATRIHLSGSQSLRGETLAVEKRGVRARVALMPGVCSQRFGAPDFHHGFINLMLKQH